MAAVSGSLGILTSSFGTSAVAGLDAEQKISPLTVLVPLEVIPFSGSFDRHRLGIAYPAKRKKPLRGDFTEEN